MSKTRIIAFVNQKGGVAKTTTVQNLGAALALRGKMVCLCDFDPQANLTEGFGINPDELEMTTYDLILKGAKVESVIKKITDNLWLLPSNLDLSGAEVELPTLAGKDLRLKKALEHLTGWDYIIIDCPPSLGQLTLNVLTAAKEVMVPLQAQFYSYKALKRLLETMAAVQQYTNPDLELTGIVCTFFRKERVLNKNVEELLREQFGAKVFKTRISDNIKLAEAPTAGKDIFTYFPNCMGAWDYKNLGAEVIEMEDRDDTQ
jgi:chromosome partitioning protein